MTNPKFCSKSCANSYNNKKFPKRIKKLNKCKLDICSNVTSGRKLYCESHSPGSGKRTIGYYRSRSSRDAQAYNTIRQLARSSYIKSNNPQLCLICNYQNHFEICHIIPLSSFDDDVEISEINSESNIVALCPNCHWELDNGLLNL